MAIPLRLGTKGNLQRFDASTPVDVPGALNVTGNITLTDTYLLGRRFQAISPTSLAAQADNYSPTGFSTADALRVVLTGSQSITGFAAPAAATSWVVEKRIINIDTVDTLTLVHESVSSTTTNRIAGPSGQNVTIPPGAVATVRYDFTTTRWRVVSLSRNLAGFVTGPASATDNAVVRYDLTTGKVVQNSNLFVDDNGNVAVTANGSTTGAPRTFSFTDFTAGEAFRMNLGASQNYLQGHFEGVLQLAAFHAIMLRGDRNTTTAPAYDTDSDVSVVAAGTVAASTVLRVRGAAAQTGDLQQWRNSADTTLCRVDSSGNLNLTNKHLDDVATANYNSWPSLTPAAGAVAVVYDDYQAATVTLNAATVTITLQTPRGPGAFKLVVLQDGTGGRNNTWATEGAEVIYAPNGTIGVSSTASSRTLVGLIYDGTSWYVVSSQPMQSV